MILFSSGTGRDAGSLISKPLGSQPARRWKQAGLVSKLFLAAVTDNDDNGVVFASRTGGKGL